MSALTSVDGCCFGLGSPPFCTEATWVWLTALQPHMLGKSGKWVCMALVTVCLRGLAGEYVFVGKAHIALHKVVSTLFNKMGIDVGC